MADLAVDDEIVGDARIDAERVDPEADGAPLLHQEPSRIWPKAREAQRSRGTGVARGVGVELLPPGSQEDRRAIRDPSVAGLERVDLLEGKDGVWPPGARVADVDHGDRPDEQARIDLVDALGALDHVARGVEVRPGVLHEGDSPVVEPVAGDGEDRLGRGRRCTRPHDRPRVQRLGQVDHSHVRDHQRLLVSPSAVSDLRVIRPLPCARAGHGI
jgi:hypothetical protein